MTDCITSLLLINFSQQQAPSCLLLLIETDNINVVLLFSMCLWRDLGQIWSVDYSEYASLVKQWMLGTGYHNEHYKNMYQPKTMVILYNIIIVLEVKKVLIASTFWKELACVFVKCEMIRYEISLDKGVLMEYTV